MKDVPKWITRIVEGENLRCNKCKDLFSIRNLMAIGIQESSMSPHSDTLCVGMFCSMCKEMTIFEIKEMSLIEFAFEILEKETEPKKITRKKDTSATLRKVGAERKKVYRSRKSKITQKELSDSIKFLRTVKSHEDFLVAMGMPPEEINKYSHKKTKPGK